MLESQDVLRVEASTVGDVVAPGPPRGLASGTGRPRRGRRRIETTR
jgi:hypothetical protein